MATGHLSEIKPGEPMFLGRKARAIVERAYMCFGIGIFLGLLSGMVGFSPEGRPVMACALSLVSIGFFAASRVVWNSQHRLSQEDKFKR
jgi:hypothetical protein